MTTAAVGRANLLLRLALGMVAAGLVAAPLWADLNALRVLGEVWTYLALATLWNLLAGFAGLVSVGQQAFVGLGGYALLAVVLFGGGSPLLGVLAAGILGAAAAVPIGAIAFRLRGAYFAIGTWAIAEVLRLFAMRIDALGGGSGTSLPVSVLRSLSPDRVTRAGIVYEVGCVIGLGCLAFAVLLLRSRWGLALRSIRDSEVGAASVGIVIQPIKYGLYCATGGLTAAVGALVLLQKLRISPDAAFSVNDWTAFVIFIVVIGGLGTVEGPLVGTVLFFVLRGLLADYGTVYLIVLGLLAVAVMLKAPRGLWGALTDRFPVSPLEIRRQPPPVRPLSAPAGPAPDAQVERVQ